MTQLIPDLIELEAGERALLLELLESAQARLLVEIRHTGHRVFRDELRARLTRVETLIERLRPLEERALGQSA